MSTYKLLIEVRKNGDYFMKSDVTTLADLLAASTTTIQKAAAVGGVVEFQGDRYMLRYTGEKEPKKVKAKKPKPKEKPNLTIAEINRLAREAGMHYGDYVAKMERGQ